jgi:hypothetical protein
MPGVLYKPNSMIGALSWNGVGLNPYSSSPFGLAPAGIRHSGEGVKGKGFFGPIPNPFGGSSTELSSEFEHGGKTIEHPLLVPTLSREEMDSLVRGGAPTDAIYKKAQAFALQRIGMGLSPFAGGSELRYPLPPAF